MKSFALSLMILLFSLEPCPAQYARENIYTEVVFFNKRQRLDKDLRENVIAKTFEQTLTADNEHKFESACWAISQFMFRSNTIENGFQKIIASYDSLELDTKRAFLEAAYGVYPVEYEKKIQTIFEKEKHPKLFAMCALYLHRINHSIENTNRIKLRMVEQFPDYDSTDLLIELDKYLSHHQILIKQSTPPVTDLLRFQQKQGNKIIYSFQRWNRDYPGLAIVQNADGSFVRREDGRLMVIEQLARSASSLPYFITNGNTPQGIYSIQGTAVANNNFIGPTPNIQLIMPFEDSLKKFFHSNWDSSIAPLKAYQSLLPDSWKNYQPFDEAFYAGKIGRTEIIAHGTTIDPDYFKNKPWYPISPTLGCLCAKEIWNVTSGHLLVSEQFNLYSAFISTKGTKGFLIVLNLDDQQKAVTREEVERFVK
ncbi:MAG: hypothetical protein ACKVOW_01095 [Chitinophagaceae bacterium]